MLDSVTIFTKGGKFVVRTQALTPRLISSVLSLGAALPGASSHLAGGTVLYHSQPSKIHHTASLSQSEDKENLTVNAFISSVLLLGQGKNASADEGSNSNRVVLSSPTTVGSPVVVEWLDGATTVDGVSSAEDRRNWIVLAVYPEVASRKLQQHCVDSLLLNAMKRYAVFYEHHKQGRTHAGSQWNTHLLVPPQDEFDSAFQSILREFQEEVSSMTASNNSLASMERKQKQKHQSTSASNKRGKEKTVWHDGKGKITKEALDQLDMSKDKDSSAPSGEIRQDLRAIAEAKIAYLPTEGERPAWEEPDAVLDELNIGWNVDAQVDLDATQDHTIGGVRNFFSKLLSPNKPLTKPDLEPPLNQMKLLLTSKNVSPKTAQAICNVVQDQLLGKQVGTLTGVKRAVRHALEDAIERILRPELGNGRLSFQKGKSLNVLRGVVDKRGRGGMMGKQKRPYVICMIGINGALAVSLCFSTNICDNSNQPSSRCREVDIPGQDCLLSAEQQMQTHACGV